MSRYITFAIFAFTLLTGCRSGEKAPDPATYRKDIEAWRTARLERLKSPEGWLNLAGLFWLRDGVNTFGSDTSNTIVFPEGAPAFTGEIIKSGDDVRFVPVRGTTVTINARPVSDTVQLKTDLTEQPTVMETGPFAWFIIKRGDRYGIRLRNYHHPRIGLLDSIPAYPASLKWRITAKYVPFTTDSTFSVSTMIGGTEEYKCPGKLIFTVGGTKTELFPFLEGEGFFIIFGDRTSGRETYPSGRFLTTGKPDSHNRVIIDFNKAYNPPCAFSPFATCPLPPPQNRLKVEITAGEKAVHME